jgi:hypothetical protein
MISKPISIDDLRKHLENARDRLSLEKQKILKAHPLPDFKREEYAFAYVRAERVGLRVINRRLAEIAWLPMQLDPKAELASDDRNSMKRWVTSVFNGSPDIAPDADIFGNDFIHTLTRCGLSFGWDGADFLKLAARIGNLFRDLSCLIGMIYYCSWLSENGIEGIELSDPDNICGSAEEIATLLQSPEMYKHLRAQEQNDEKAAARKRALPKPDAKSAKDKTGQGGGQASGQSAARSSNLFKRARPDLRVIENKNFTPSFPGGFTPDPATV